jgi:hypothetical protein
MNINAALQSLASQLINHTPGTSLLLDDILDSETLQSIIDHFGERTWKRRLEVLFYINITSRNNIIYNSFQDDTIKLLDICIGRSTVAQAPKPWTVYNPCRQDVTGIEIEAVMGRNKTITCFFIKDCSLMIIIGFNFNAHSTVNVFTLTRLRPATLCT